MTQSPGSVQDFLNALPNPDVIGQSEYRYLHELLQDIEDSRLPEDTDPEVLALMDSSLDEVTAWAKDLKRRIRKERQSI